MDQDARFHLNNAYINSPLAINDLRIVQIGRRYCKENTGIRSHSHLKWFELTIITKGNGVIISNSKRCEVKPGDIHLSLPFDVHEICSTESLEYDFFSFYFEDSCLATEFDNLIFNNKLLESRVVNDERISYLINNAIAEFVNSSLRFNKDLLYSIFTQVAIYLLRDLNDEQTDSIDTSSNQALCYQIMNYIDTHIYTIDNLTTVAESMHYNYAYISALFKRTTGETIFNYYQNRKLNEALVLMSKNKKICDIAEQLGYQDQFSFSRAFKAKFGLSPVNFMKKNAVNPPE